MASYKHTLPQYLYIFRVEERNYGFKCKLCRKNWTGFPGSDFAAERALDHFATSEHLSELRSLNKTNELVDTLLALVGIEE